MNANPKQGIFRFFYAVWNAVECVVAVVLFAMFVLTSLIAILRYVFNSSIFGGNELVGHMFVYITALGAPLLFYSGDHINVDFFEHAPAGVRKGLQIFDLIACIAVQALFLYYSIGWISMVGDFLTPLLAITQKYIQCAVPICMGLGIFFCVGKLLELFLGAPESQKEDDRT